ncbi:MAG: hypothetical protein F9K29_18720 [Hyphomicrobiaceae bacterium]|nr:MAG: hypothetical protein F9K29_18720 [Hyphomicrobiaceae bacterium]
MTNASRLPHLNRRAVLGGLAAGAGLALAARLALAEDEAGAPPSGPRPIEVRARPILHFDRNRPDVKRFGDLEFRGGLVLTSPSQHFGGWSGLAMEADGKSLLAVSDIGSWLTADISYDGVRPVALTQARLGPLRDKRGRSLRNKHEQDAEAVTLIEGNLSHGTVLIGFERLHRIGRFEIRNREVQPPTGYLKMPAEARRMRSNQGFEALTVLRAGAFKGAAVAFAERLTGGSGYHTGWIWIDNEPKRFQLRDIDEFNITGAVGLPDGGLLVLERSFRWTEGVKMRLRRLMPEEVRPGARVNGRVLLQANSGYDIDNMEGIGVHRAPGGELVVSLISDDNFNSLLQRTVFLQFTLNEHGAKNVSRP